MKKVSNATVALAFAIWDAENTTRLERPDDQAITIRRAQQIQHWLKLHKAKVVKTK